MRSRYSNQPYDQGDSRNNYDQSNEKSVSRGQWFFPAIDFTLMDLLQKLLMGFKRLFIALKYQFYKKASPEETMGFGSGSARKWKIPWFKVGLVGIVIFLFTQKDIQFSINMRAPLGGEESVGSSGDSDADRQPMNVAQAIPMKNSVKREKKGERNTAGQGLSTYSTYDANAYISRFRKVALMEMKKFGIPASIKMAWGILDSQAGNKPARLEDNNHFGAIMEGTPFATAWENWRAHSLLLQEQYPGLFQGGNDYRQWVKMLDQADISGDKQFGQKLNRIIEQYELHQLDLESI